jgi:hypothetical protein
MIEPDNGQVLSPTQDNRPRYTGELLLRTRPRVYRQIIRLLSENVSAHQICKLCHVTRETVRAVERREAAEISARKKSIIGVLSNVAELGASRMEETIGKASLRDAAIGTGIAVDKLLALQGQPPHLPKRLTKQFVAPALATAELVQEILKMAGRRLFVTFQPKQPCDFVVAEGVHLYGQMLARQTNSIADSLNLGHPPTWTQNLSDNFGHWNCVILRESCKVSILCKCG